MTGLYRAGAVNVRAGISRDGQRERLAQLPVEIVHSDVIDHESRDAAMNGVNLIVNCAHSRFDDGLIVRGMPG